MMDRRSRREKALVAYYGLIQAAHLAALLRAGVILLITGRLTFPAPPPPAGWTDQARYFLVTLGTLDTLLIGLSFVYVAGYFRQARRHRWLGLATLSAFTTSAFAFAGGTLPRSIAQNRRELCNTTLWVVPCPTNLRYTRSPAAPGLPAPSPTLPSSWPSSP